MPTANEANNLRLKTGLAEMLKGGVIMDVTNAEQATIAEQAGAAAVMALERVPAQIRAEGGVARMASPKKIREIMEAVSIPVMAKCRIGHFAEAQILQELGVDYVIVHTAFGAGRCGLGRGESKPLIKDPRAASRGTGVAAPNVTTSTTPGPDRTGASSPP